MVEYFRKGVYLSLHENWNLLSFTDTVNTREMWVNIHRSPLLIFSELHFLLSFNEDVMLIQSKYIMINVHAKSIKIFSKFW